MSEDEKQNTGIVTALAELPREAILDERALAQAFSVHPRTIRRMVTRYEMPPPVRMAGRSVWIAGRVLEWINHRLELIENDSRRAMEKIIRIAP